MNSANRNGLNDIILGIVREMEPISLDEIWFEMGESLNVQLIPSKKKLNFSLEQMEKRKILKKVMFPNGREKYLLYAK